MWKFAYYIVTLISILDSFIYIAVTVSRHSQKKSISSGFSSGIRLSISATGRSATFQNLPAWTLTCSNPKSFSAIPMLRGLIFIYAWTTCHYRIQGCGKCL